MIHTNPIFKSFSFIPSRLVYHGPEAPPEATDSQQDDIRERLQAIDESDDAPLLRDALVEWIAVRYPDVADRLADRPIGILLEGAAEIGGLENSDASPADIIQEILEKAFEHRYPNGEHREVIERVNETMRSPLRSRSSARARGAQMIQEAGDRITSPELEELRKELENIQFQYDNKVETSNRAVIQYIKREMLLTKLLEEQGYQYDSTEQATDFYHFTMDYKLVVGNETYDRAQEEFDARDQAEISWNSWGWQFERSNKEVVRYEALIKRVESKIRAEEAKVAGAQ